MSRRGLTILELMVVVAIIAVLIGLFAGVVIGARRSANTAVCASNLRQLGHGMRMYADDNRGLVLRAPGFLSPPTADVMTDHYMSWAEGYARYLDPAWTQQGMSVRGFNLSKCPEHPMPWAESNFVVNAVALREGQPRRFGPLKFSLLSQIVNPAGVPYLVDSADQFRPNPMHPGMDFTLYIAAHTLHSELQLPNRSHTTVAASRHGEGFINSLFFDGHVQLITTKGMTLSLFDDGIR